MADLPTGTVTFLFTDIEGSTKLLQRLGQDYRAVRDRHAAIIRSAMEAEGGRELSTAGDSFFAVFRSAGGAVRAAVVAQRELHDHRWPPGAALRVRMGIHTGEGTLGGEDYVGIDVNRAARVMDAGHGSGDPFGSHPRPRRTGASSRDHRPRPRRSPPEGPGAPGRAVRPGDRWPPLGLP